jgi:hypothetical protein
MRAERGGFPVESLGPVDGTIERVSNNDFSM